jgi:SAM-dependent methyltransferase
MLAQIFWRIYQRALRPWVGYDRRRQIQRIPRQIKRILTGAGNPHWARITMDQATKELIERLPFAQFDVLEISPYNSRWKDFGFKSYQEFQYPEYDICTSTPTGDYDLIIAEQIFEHLHWPYRAARNIFAMLRPGGYFLITTPFLVRIHESPVDCTRWSETGLKYFLAESGFTMSQIWTGSWGNRACIKANLKKWVDYCAWRHSLSNEPAFPFHVWALAKKPVLPARTTLLVTPNQPLQGRGSIGELYVSSPETQTAQKKNLLAQESPLARRFQWASPSARQRRLMHA